MTTYVGCINPRLISAVSPEPARLLAAAAAELADRWDSGNYDLGEAEAVTETHTAMVKAVRELDGALDGNDKGLSW